MMPQSRTKRKAKRTPRASMPRKSATKSKPPAKAAKPAAAKGATANAGGARRVDDRLRVLGGWRAETLAEVRRLIHDADPEITEDCKWVKPTNPLGVPVWSHTGIICTGEAYKQVVKLTFARGASLKDPQQLFNSSLEGNTRRAIDIREGEPVNARALKALIQAAVVENLRSSAPKSKSPPKAAPKAKPVTKKAQSVAKKVTSSASEAKGVKLLSGGNPQIAKGDGDAPVQAYIAAMSGWKRDIGKRLDALIVASVPKVCKAVKWNSPFYGIEGQGWFLAFHVFTHYVKVTFFKGRSLRPLPPSESKDKETRYYDIREGELDEKQFAKWVKQAAAQPGWMS